MDIIISSQNQASDSGSPADNKLILVRERNGATGDGKAAFHKATMHLDSAARRPT